MDDVTQTPCTCRMCELEAAGLHPDDYLVTVVDQVGQSGWAVQTVAEDRAGPGWAYSVGLWHSYHAPDLAVFGLPPASMTGIINTFGRYISSGSEFEPGDRIDGVCPCTLTLRPVDVSWRLTSMFSISDTVHGLLRPALLQIVWPDRDGLFPWDRGFAAELAGRQPMLWLPRDDNPPGPWTRLDDSQ